MKIVAPLFALACVAIFAALGRNVPTPAAERREPAETRITHVDDTGDTIEIRELPYGRNEGLISRKPLTYQSSADLTQRANLAGIERVVIVSSGRREDSLNIVDGAHDHIEIRGRFVRSIGGYHGAVPETYEWRSKKSADVAFTVERDATTLTLRNPSAQFIHHVARFETLHIAVPRHIPLELRYEFHRGDNPLPVPAAVVHDGGPAR